MTTTAKRTTRQLLAPIVVSVDGQAGAGKGTLITGLAKKYKARGLPAVALSSGSLYRAVAYLAMRLIGFDPLAPQTGKFASYDYRDLPIKAWTSELVVTTAQYYSLRLGPDGQPWFSPGSGHADQPIEAEYLKNPAVDHYSSVFSSPEDFEDVRTFVNSQIINFAQSHQGVLLTDGRDMSQVMSQAMESVKGGKLAKLSLKIDPRVAAKRTGTSVALLNERNERDAAQTIIDPEAWTLNVDHLDKLGVLLACDAHLTTVVPELAPRLTILQGPSGVGKSTVIKKVRELIPSIQFAISQTTRARRPGETSANYDFVTHEEFRAGIDAGNFLEHAVFGGNYYGTPLSAATRLWTLLEIEIDGVRQVKARIPDVRHIRLVPPGQDLDEQIAVLKARLEADTTQSRNNVEARLAAVRVELSGPSDFTIVNYDADKAAREIAAIF